MGKLKGQVEYEKFKRGERLTRRESMVAHCYQCNGFESSNEDCKGKSCPLYEYSPYKGVERANSPKMGKNGELVAEGEIAQTTA